MTVSGNIERTPFEPVVIDADDLAAHASRAATALDREVGGAALSTARQRSAALRALFSAAPELESIWNRFTSGIADRGAVLLKGFPIESDAAFISLACALGEPMMTPGGTIIDHVTPKDGFPGNAASGSQSRSALPPHSESSASASPPGFLILGCVANDSDGGDTTVIEVGALVQALEDDGHEREVRLLGDSVFPTVHVPTKPGEQPVVTRILYRGEGEHWCARFRGEQLLAGDKMQPDLLDDAHRSALHVFIEYAWDGGFAREVHLGPGDVLGFSNGRMLHGRTAIVADARRDLKRIATK